MEAALCGLLFGCTALEPAPPAPKPPPPAPPAEAPAQVAASAPESAARTPRIVDPADAAARHFLAYHERLRRMPVADLAKELQRIGDTPVQPAAIIEFATVLGYMRGPGDMVRAQGILDPLLRSTAPEAEPWQPIARLLSARYLEQRRIEEQLERANNQAREQQKRIDLLNEKLEALKAIERSLTLRPGAGPATAPPSAPARTP